MGRLTDDMTRLGGEISVLRSSGEVFISDLRYGISELKAGAEKMQSGFPSEHAEMSWNMKTDLFDFIFKLKEFVLELAEDVSDMQSGFRKAHAKMAAETKRERKRLLSELGQSSNVLRQEIAGFRKEFTVDIAGDRRVCFGHFSAEVSSDDFTVITGIGPALQGRLNKAGYYTFVQLANSTPEKLREILGESARSANVKNWIEYARDLAQ
jgi:predicted flap endonuclease-1-like 5' DNA nuclease